MTAVVHPVIAHLLIGRSVVMEQLRAQIERIAPTGIPVLIQGPTGAGKELVAEALHARSGRHGRFVPFNVCAIGDGMLEDALFGHVRGAFTGALADARGFLLEADRGTAFFDEIGTLPLTAQVKLLRAVETKRFRPVGGGSDRESDFRVVSATNEDIGMLVRSGRFRADLAQRLAGWVLEVPPLRARLEDIGDLVTHFSRDVRAPEGARFSVCALATLQDYHWPGNVRELRHVVECAAILAPHGSVSRDEIRMVIDGVRRSIAPVTTRERSDPLLTLLRDLAWDVRAAAEQLGVHRATIYRRLQRLGVTAPREPSRVGALVTDAARAGSCDSRATVAAGCATDRIDRAWPASQLLE